jgi:hypothetical protein
MKDHAVCFLVVQGHLSWDAMMGREHGLGRVAFRGNEGDVWVP